jgi:hypothetical protein
MLKKVVKHFEKCKQGLHLFILVIFLGKVGEKSLEEMLSILTIFLRLLYD